MESSFYRRSKINKYTRRLLKTRRGRLDITLWPYEDYSITQDDSPRMTRWATITWRELLHETRWLDEDHSTRVTQWGWLDEGNSTRVTRRGDDSKRTTRRGSHDEARWFNETTLSHKGGTSVLRIVLTSLFYFISDLPVFITFFWATVFYPDDGRGKRRVKVQSNRESVVVLYICVSHCVCYKCTLGF